MWIEDWKLVMTKAWSVRFWAAAGLLETVNVGMPLLAAIVMPWWVSVVILALMWMGFAARFMQQHNYIEVR